jgi:hypothetical protein
LLSIICTHSVDDTAQLLDGGTSQIHSGSCRRCVADPQLCTTSLEVGRRAAESWGKMIYTGCAGGLGVGFDSRLGTWRSNRSMAIDWVQPPHKYTQMQNSAWSTKRRSDSKHVAIVSCDARSAPNMDQVRIASMWQSYHVMHAARRTWIRSNNGTPPAHT